jgi:hypothetical protein
MNATLYHFGHGSLKSVDGYTQPRFVWPAIGYDDSLKLFVLNGWNEKDENPNQLSLPTLPDGIDFVSFVLICRIIAQLPRIDDAILSAAATTGMGWGGPLTGKDSTLIGTYIGMDQLSALMTEPLAGDEVESLVHMLMYGIKIDLGFVASAVKAKLLSWRHIYWYHGALPSPEMYDLASVDDQLLRPYEKYFRAYAHAMGVNRYSFWMSDVEEFLLAALARRLDICDGCGPDIAFGMALLKAIPKDDFPEAEYMEGIGKWCRHYFKGKFGLRALHSFAEYKQLFAILNTQWDNMEVIQRTL